MNVVVLRPPRPNPLAARRSPTGTRPWDSFLAWTLGASLAAALPCFALVTFMNPPLPAPWLGIGALIALVGLLALASWLMARPVMALSRAAADLQSGDLAARAIPTGGGETRGNVVPAVQRQSDSGGSIRLALELIANKSRGLMAAAAEVAATAAAEAKVATDLAAHGWNAEGQV